MKKILIASCALLAVTMVMAQQKEGKVTYDRTVQLQISFPGMSEEMQQQIPRTRTEHFELHFANNQSVWKQEQANDDGDFVGDPGEGGGGIQFRFSSQGSNDILFNDFNKSRRVESREMMDKKFLIDDSIRPLKWKMTGETKTILGHNCMKATATQISQRSQMTMNDGKMERKEISDTSVVIAWFATDIPVSAGPGEFQGQLPGLILDLDAGNGRFVYKATKITEKPDVALIKEPTGKKRLTQAEFRTERDKMFKEMEANGGGGGRRIIRMQ
jgi:GLPGLI family protein